ncbi:SET domain-containing protein-lysine N-methyltransferase [Endozoicomonas sp.]|uniref:SET domain-containing protein-lysine N-methyltransferase n=1 Tax=Endozoicomonas sp. TaxID=1892382 RepID=UPI00383A5C47
MSKTKILLPAVIKNQLTRDSENNHLLNQHYWSELVEHWLSMDGDTRQNHIETQLTHTIINHTDPRKKLHWQSGVLAARDIPAYCVIAPYAGLYCIGSDILKEKSRFGTNVDRYAVNCPMDNIQIYLCGYGHGNITLCINANTTYSDKDPFFKDNVCFVVVIYQGWPYTFIVSISPIKKNHEVLIDYGRHYWKEHGDDRSNNLNLPETSQPPQ